MNFIFSSFNKDITSQSQILKEGDWEDFHRSRIFFRAINEVKAIILDCTTVRVISSVALPNIATCGDGQIFTSKIFPRVLKKEYQKLCNFGHDQNICVKLQGTREHLSHFSFTWSE